MPKMKSNRSAAKRFRLTATGKVRRNQAFARHILTKKVTETEAYSTSHDACVCCRRTAHKKTPARLTRLLRAHILV